MLNVTDETFADHVLTATNPVLVYFWAPWCKLCHRVEPTLIKMQGEFAHPIDLVSVNADENLKLSTTHRLKILPTVLVFAGGKVVYRLEGFPGRDELQRSLTQMGLNLFAASA